LRWSEEEEKTVGWVTEREWSRGSDGCASGFVYRNKGGNYERWVRNRIRLGSA
jgi:hypothetical protein